MAHPPYGSAQKGRTRFALYCVAVILRRFLCQGAEPGRKDTGCGKGTLPVYHIRPRMKGQPA